MIKFEYNTEFNIGTRNGFFSLLEADEQLSALGQEGWDLVSVVTMDTSTVYFFKRIKVE